MALKPGFSVLELCHQGFAPTIEIVRDAMRRELGMADVEAITGPATLYERLGASRYDTVDGHGGGGAHRFDDDAERSIEAVSIAEFDLVTNYGATASLFDQATVFRNIHIWTAAGGLMIHTAPLNGFGADGLICYPATFFATLAAANGYDVLGYFVGDSEGLHDCGARIPLHHPGAIVNGLIVAVLRRVTTEPFRIPEVRPSIPISVGTAAASTVSTDGDGFDALPLNASLRAIRSRLASKRPDPRGSEPALRGGWDGVGDPFEYHAEAAICALSEGVAAIYGFDVRGDVAEFGTMSGRTAVGLARAIQSCDKALGYAAKAYSHGDRRLVLFDSFEGLPELAADSVDGLSPHVQSGVWRPGALWGVPPEQLAAMTDPYLPRDRVDIVPGWFSDTVRLLTPNRQFALLHIDCDLYSSTMDVLDTLFSRGMVSRGAYIFFDDWNCNGADPDLGERRAWRELVSKYDIAFSDERSYAIFSHCFVVHSYLPSAVD